MSITIRTIEPDEYRSLTEIATRAFGSDVADGDLERFSTLLAPERTSCAFDGPRMVGTCGAYELTLAVPGGVLPMAGTTLITVEQTHRRQGLLRRMMSDHLDQAKAHGDPIAGLWASEGGIYGRYGFGRAAIGHRVEVNRDAVRLRPADTGTEIELLADGDVAEALPPVYERCWRDRPGMISRTPGWWRCRVIADPPGRREGASAKRHVLCTRGGEAEGFVTYRHRASEATFGHGTLEVLDLTAATQAARLALWRYVLSIDLFPEVHAWSVPADDPLEWSVDNPYALRRSQIDNIWIALLDVPRALEGRGYRAETTLRIEVVGADDGVASGRFSLETSPAGSRCTPTSREPEVTVPAAALGALYLGRRCARPMADAGLVRGDADAIDRLDAIFAWTREPWCPEVF